MRLIFVDWCSLSKICFWELPCSELEISTSAQLMSIADDIEKLTDCTTAYQTPVVRMYQTSNLDLQRYSITFPNAIIERGIENSRIQIREFRPSQQRIRYKSIVSQIFNSRQHFLF
jgi:hypothetical protein